MSGNDIWTACHSSLLPIRAALVIRHGRKNTQTSRSTPPARGGRGERDQAKEEAVIKDEKIVYCDFCEKSQAEVSIIVVSPNKHAAVCNECVAVVVETMLGPKPTKTPVTDPT